MALPQDVPRTLNCALPRVQVVRYVTQTGRYGSTKRSMRRGYKYEQQIKQRTANLLSFRMCCHRGDWVYASTMTDWLQQLKKSLNTNEQLVLINVLRVAGSVPRQPGAKMIVTAQSQWGTIGGGNLEYSAINLARTRLRDGQVSPHCEVLSLGPSLGQCCGGRVELLFEVIDAQNSPHLMQPRPAVVTRAISGVHTTSFEPFNSGTPVVAKPVIETVGDCLFLHEPLHARLPSVWVFGAGHVGRSVVDQLKLLPCEIVWLDEREEMFADIEAGSVNVVCTDDITLELDRAPNDVTCVVMTHSHALDYELCRSILARRFGFLALIGSTTKRANFARRLKHHGFDEAQIGRIVCPLGVGRLRSKHPHAIALSLALQLMEYWEQVDIYREEYE